MSNEDLEKELEHFVKWQKKMLKREEGKKNTYQSFLKTIVIQLNMVQKIKKKQLNGF